MEKAIDVTDSPPHPLLFFLRSRARSGQWFSSHEKRGIHTHPRNRNSLPQQNPGLSRGRSLAIVEVEKAEHEVMKRRSPLLSFLLVGGLLFFLVACEEGGSFRARASTPYPLRKAASAGTVWPSVTRGPREAPPTLAGTSTGPASTSTLQPCGLTVPLVSAGPVAGIQVFAGPYPARPGSSLFYCVTFEASRYEIPVPLRVHLPEGARLVRVSGAGWMCTPETNGAYGLTCTNARAGRGVSSLLLEVIMPSTSGPWQACVELAKPPSPRVCVTVRDG